MNYLLTLTDDVTDSKIDAAKDEILRLGAKYVEYMSDMRIVLVESDVKINFAGIDGIEFVQEEKDDYHTLIKGDM